MTDEKSLVQASLAGDSRSFERLVEKYQAMICGITFSATGRLETSEELAQETFLRAWKNLAQLREFDKFRFWLCSIARNLLRTYYQQKHSDKVSVCDTDTLETLASPSVQSPTDTLISREEEMMLNQALMQIPEEYREPLVLYYRQEQSTKEVAESLDIPEATVRTRMHRGRQMLKDQVAAMVENTLAKSGPTKKFTKAVMVAIGAGLAAGTAATAGAAAAGVAGSVSTAAGGASAVLTGIGMKVAAIVAAVLLIGSGVLVYSYWNPSNHSSTSEQVVRTEPVSVQSVSEKADSTPAAKVQVSPKPVEPPQANPPANLSQNSTEKEPASLSQDTSATKSGTGISGIIIDKSTSKPIKDAEIFCGRDSSTSVFSDTNGRFELLGIKPYPRQFYVIAKHYATRTIVAEIIKDKMYHDFKVELVPGSKVSGIVSDPNGNPIEGATVETFSFTSRPVKTDKNGEFEIDGMDPAFGQYSLHTSHPNYPAMSTEFSPAAAGQTTIADIILKPGITVYGKVTNAQGQPLSDVSVGNTTSRSMWNCIQTKTDNEGLYTLKNIPEGDFVLWAVTDQYAPYVEYTILDSSHSTKLINIQLADPCPIHGKIIDAMGNPVPGVKISLREYKRITLGRDRTTSDSDGKFTISNGPREGQMILEVFGESIPNTKPEFEAGLEQVYIIKVDRAGRIYGKVVDDRTGEPVGKFNVKLAATTKGTPAYGYSATWDRQGHMFESSQGFFDTGIDTIPVGAQYAVTVTAEGFDSLCMDPVTVQAISDYPNRTEFRLKTATAITGRIVDCNSMPIRDAFIRRLTEKNKLAGEHWGPSDTATTDSTGIFTLSGIGAGDGAVYITAPTFAPYIGQIANLPRNSKAAVEIILNPGASIFGKVIDSNGQGLMGAKVSAHIFMEQLQQIFNSPYPNLKSVTAETDGYYEIVDLPAGNFSVSVNTSAAQGNQNYAHKKISLKAGESLEINFGNEPGFTVAGVVRKGRQLLEKARVEITFPDQSRKCEYTDKKGHFIIRGVPEGTHRIFIDYDLKDDTSTSPTTFQHIYEMRQIDMKDNTNVDIDFGSGSVKGKIPVQYLTHEDLRFLAGHCRNKQTDSSPFSGFRKTIEGKIDSQGNYECSGLCSGWYYLQLYTPEQTLAVSEAFEVGESQHIENIPLKSGNGKLQIHFVDSENKQDVASANFTLQNEYGAGFHSKKLSGENMGGMITDSHGMADFQELPPGKYVIKAQAPGYLACQSELLTVDNSNITPITVYLHAVCAVRFEYSEQIKSKITANNAYLICQVTNLDTQKLIPKDSIHASYFEEEQLVWLKKIGNVKGYSNALLTLPPGRYEIQYSLYQDKDKTLSYKVQTPLFTGSFQVDLAKRDTKTLTIAQNQ